MELATIKRDINTLGNAENTVHTLLPSLAIAVVQRVHEHNDITTLNTLLLKLQNLNRKGFIKFVNAFAGHKFNEKEGVFTSRRSDFKNKEGVTVSPYNEAKTAFASYIESGLTIWQWLAIEKSKETKPVDMSKIQKAAGKLHKMLGEAQAAGIIDTVGSLQLLLGQSPMTQDELMAGLGAVFAAKKAIDKAEDAAMDEALNKAAA